jgi:hypothetical protein
MRNNRCANCGFLNFADASACKRCKASFDAPSAISESVYSSADEYAWQPQYQTAPDYPQPFYPPQYFPTPVAALPRRSKHSGTNAALLSLLGVAVIVAAAIGVLWKFGKAAPSTFGWQEYKADDESFTVEMPTKPVETVQSESTPMGEIDSHVLMGNMRGDGIYVVAYTDFPSGASNASADSILESVAQGSLDNSGATMLSKKKITLDGYPGLEVEMKVPASKVPGGGHATCRLYWVAPRIYVMFVGSHESSEIYRDRARFLDSFKLRKKLA